LTQNDPTDHALAAIASILDHKETPEPSGFEFKPDEPKSDEPETVHAAEIFTVVKEIITVTTVSQPETLVTEHESPATVPEPLDVDGYSRLGPGPLDAIRFRWIARRDEDGQYFVDEIIGTSSRPISLGPMPRDEVIQFIDDREQAARRRFDELKSSMTLGHHDGSGRPR
jgi:hypothetical protein